MSGEQIWELRRDLWVRTFGDEQAIYDPLEDHTLLLNGAASVVVGFCDGRHTIDEIVDEIRTLYPASPEVRVEVMGIIDGLKEARLLSAV